MLYRCFKCEWIGEESDLIPLEGYENCLDCSLCPKCNFSVQSKKELEESIEYSISELNRIKEYEDRNYKK